MVPLPSHPLWSSSTLIGPFQTNSQFFSALPPARAMTYPDITVQMPVYKEGLEAVVLPSIVSLEVSLG